MWKRLLVPAALIFSLQGLAQNEPKVPLIGAPPSLYILHQLQPGETLSGVATAYNTKVGDVMRLNGMNKDSKLNPSQVINIPVPVANIKQTPGGLALVHRVVPGESLYRISVNHGKVPVANLQQWNQLAGNAISLGQDLVVGYLPVTGSPSGAQAASAQAQALQQTQAGGSVVTGNPNTAAPAAGAAPVTSPSTATNQPAATTATAPPTGTTPTVAPTMPPYTKPASEQPQPPPPSTSPVPNPDPATSPANTTMKALPGEGFFANQFGKNVEGRDKKTAAGNAAIFKTAAGWTDRKYYVLMDAVPPGQIVELSNGSKKVYAKVLWNMRDMKENEGYTYRISNAAAAALGISDTKFNLTVTYFE